jgi:hypothetical protein
MEMNERFPALSGPLLLHAIRYVAAGYPFGYHLIYVAIWCDKQATHEELTSCAGKQHLVLYDAGTGTQIGPGRVRGSHAARCLWCLDDLKIIKRPVTATDYSSRAPSNEF